MLTAVPVRVDSITVNRLVLLASGALLAVLPVGCSEPTSCFDVEYVAGFEVRNAATGAPICDAEVGIDGKRANGVQLTGSLCGYWVFFRPGTYQVEVRRANFNSATFTAVVTGETECNTITGVTPRTVAMYPLSGDGSCHNRCGTPSCGTCPTPTMIDVGGYKIDASKVLVSDYWQFLAAIPAVDASLPECSTASGWPLDLPSHGPGGFSFCAAMTYCLWTGRRLCGKIGGGPNGFDDYANPDLSQWYHACSVPLQGYHYLPLSGMLDDPAEWEDSCSNGQCRVRGGRSSDAGRNSCNDPGAASWTVKDQYAFRCCDP